MGQEVRLFLTEADENALITSLPNTQQLVILRVVWLKEEDRLITSMSQLGLYPTDGQLVFALPDQSSSLVTIKYPDGHVRIDIGDSNVIEYSRSMIDGNKLRPGRLWYQPKGPMGKKPKEFLQWAKSVLALAKRHLVAVDEPIQAFAGSHAIEKMRTSELEFTSW